MATAALVAVVGAVRPAGAEEGMVWRYRRQHPVDYAAAATFAGVAIADRFVPEPREVLWTRGPSFDGALRDAIALGAEDHRLVAARLSDVTLGLLATQLVIDGAVVWLAHDGADAAWQVSWINATAFAFNVAATGVIKRVGGRDRPIQTACEEDPGYDSSCAGGRPPRSSLSGHASSAFTAASLTCLHLTDPDRAWQTARSEQTLSWR